MMAKEKLYWKICFPYTAKVLVPSLVKHALFRTKSGKKHVFCDFLKNGNFWSKFNITKCVPCKIPFLKMYTFLYFNEFV